MSTTRFVTEIIAAGLMILGMGVASGQQDFPSKPIRILAAPAGGGVDFAARVIAQGISAPLGQPVVIDNRVAAIAIESLPKTPPDGYTTLVMGVPLWLTPYLQDNVPWDPVRDFSPIIVVTRQISYLVVHPSLPVKSVKDLITLAKTRAGELNYASGAIGGSTHLAPELFKAMAGVNIVHIPYKGTGAAIINLIGGQVQLMFAASSTIAPHIKSGRLRALAVTSAQPSTLFPELPSVAASLPGYELEERLGMFAPAKTPVAIINRLNQEVGRVLNSAEVKEKFFNSGSEVVGGSPEQLSAAIKSDMTRLGKLIKDAGIRAD